MSPERRLALASQSPRRKQLLDQLALELGLKVVTLLPAQDEDPEGLEVVLKDESPIDYVQRVTSLKAQVGWRRMQSTGSQMPVLVSDTTVALRGQILGKPKSTHEAKQMLRTLAGEIHQVHTAVGLALPTSDSSATGLRAAADPRSAFFYVQTLSSSDVKFSDCTEDWIDWVVATGEPMDKAGAYAIQGHAASVIEWVRGSPSGIMGLPLFETRQLLRRHLEL